MHSRDCMVYSSHWSLWHRAPQAFGLGQGDGVRWSAQAGTPTRSEWTGHDYPGLCQITANVPAVMGNAVAQGDSNSIGCRIVVNGQVKAERISNEVNAYTHCLVKSA